MWAWVSTGIGVWSSACIHSTKMKTTKKFFWRHFHETLHHHKFLYNIAILRISWNNHSVFQLLDKMQANHITSWAACYLGYSSEDPHSGICVRVRGAWSYIVCTCSIRFAWWYIVMLPQSSSCKADCSFEISGEPEDINHVTDTLLSLGWAIPTTAWALTSLQRLYEQVIADTFLILPRPVCMLSC